MLRGSGDCQSSSSPKEDPDEQHEHHEGHRHDDEQDCHHRRERWRLWRIVVVKEPAATDPHLFLRRQCCPAHDRLEQLVGKIASSPMLCLAAVMVEQVREYRIRLPLRLDDDGVRCFRRRLIGRARRPLRLGCRDDRRVRRRRCGRLIAGPDHRTLQRRGRDDRGAGDC
jgi:hypothetical protein